MEDTMLVSATWNVADHRVVETKGEVFGLIVRARQVTGPRPRLRAR